MIVDPWGGFEAWLETLVFDGGEGGVVGGGGGWCVARAVHADTIKQRWEIFFQLFADRLLFC